MFTRARLFEVLLVKDSFSRMVLTKSIAIIFFDKKIVRSFCSAKATHIFLAKHDSVFTYITFENLLSS